MDACRIAGKCDINAIIDNQRNMIAIGDLLYLQRLVQVVTATAAFLSQLYDRCAAYAGFFYGMEKGSSV